MFHLVKLTYDELLSNVAFNLILRPCKMAMEMQAEAGAVQVNPRF